MEIPNLEAIRDWCKQKFQQKGDYVNKSGGTMTGELILAQGSMVSRQEGVSGTNGYINAIRIKVKTTYVNHPIVFGIGGRGWTRPRTISVYFDSASTLDPTLNSFTIDAAPPYPVAIVKSEASTWDIYIQKNEGYGSIGISDAHVFRTKNAIELTFPNSLSSTIPSGYILPTVVTWDKSETANKLSTARTIFGQSFDGSANIEGQGLFYGTPVDNPNNMFANCGLQIRENGLAGGTQANIKYAPSIGFHWVNRVASMLCMNSSGNFIFYRQDGVSGADINAGNMKPQITNTYTSGNSSYKWKEVWCSTPAISSSDRNLKKNIKNLSSDERYIKFFMNLQAKSYLFKDGESGRTHVGFISQDVEEAMKECGLSDLEFAGFCKDQKKKRIPKMQEIVHPANEETGEEEWTEEIEVDFDEELVFDEDGNPVYEYSLRYEEFIALNTMMIQNLSDKLSDMEDRISKLEKLVLN